MKTSHYRAAVLLALAATWLGANAAGESKPAGEQVPFPKDYATAFTVVRAANKPAQTQLGTIYANAPAAAVRELAQLPYPDGAVFVMEWAQPLKNAAGELQVDASGNWKKGAVARVDIMRREKDSGVAADGQRAGNWAFASYRADGTPFSPAPDLTSCVACHAKAAARDFVFRGRFPALVPP